MDVHHGELAQDRGRDDAPEGHDDGHLGVDPDEIVHVLADRDAEVERCLLYRVRCCMCTTPATAIRPGDAQHDVVPRLDQGAQRRHRHLRGAEVGEPGHPITVGQAESRWWRSKGGGKREGYCEKRLERPSGSDGAKSSVRLRRIFKASLR